MDYMEVPIAPLGDGTCSDNACPCGFPGANIPRGTGFLYVSEDVVEFRRDALTVQEAQRKLEEAEAGGRDAFGMKPDGFFMIDRSAVMPTLVCEMGARNRGLDLEVAAEDARQWWRTGTVPLRETPLEGQAKPRKRRLLRRG